MKVQWDKWGLGGKLIFSASCVGGLSFFLPWVDVGLFSRNGITQGSILFGALYIYPTLKLLKNEAINRPLGISMATLAAALTVTYILSKSTANFFGELPQLGFLEESFPSQNASAFGAHLFLISSIMMLVGISDYRPVGANSSASMTTIGAQWCTAIRDDPRFTAFKIDPLRYGRLALLLLAPYGAWLIYKGLFGYNESNGLAVYGAILYFGPVLINRGALVSRFRLDHRFLTFGGALLLSSLLLVAAFWWALN